jgi:peptidoglycan/LPS O-acetylase OafA/YrhL
MVPLAHRIQYRQPGGDGYCDPALGTRRLLIDIREEESMPEQRTETEASTHRDSVLAPLLPQRLPSLDGLRAVSIAFVVIGHLAETRGAPAFLAPLSHLGNLGVKVFFVISGFLITTLLLKEYQKTQRISLRGFFARRTVRIFPAFFAYVGVIVLLQALGYFTLRDYDLIHAVTYTMNYHNDRAWQLNHLWSLAVEEQFYLLWPLLLCVLGVRRALTCAAIAVAFAPVCRVVMWYQLDASPTAMTRQFQAVADALATGCLLAGYYNYLGTKRRYTALLASRWFLLVPGLILALGFGTAGHSRGLFYTVGQSLCNLAIVLCVDRFVRFPGTLTGRLLNTRLLVYVGVLSYSLYLWQQLFLNPMDEVSSYTAFPQNIVFAVLAALGSYYLVERPFLKRRRGARHTEPAPRPSKESSGPTVQPPNRIPSDRVLTG